MPEQIRKAQTGEPTNNKGHFGSKPNSQPEAALVEDLAVTMSVQALARPRAEEHGVPFPQHEALSRLSSSNQISDRFTRSSVHYNLEQVLDVRSDFYKGSRKLRARLRRDQRDEQSLLAVEMWTASGWAPVVSDTTGTRIHGLPLPQDSTKPEAESAARQAVFDALVDATQIIAE